jgi:hypothetical protein
MVLELAGITLGLRDQHCQILPISSHNDLITPSEQTFSSIEMALIR